MDFPSRTHERDVLSPTQRCLIPVADQRMMKVFMDTEKRIISYGIAGSLAVHALAILILALMTSLPVAEVTKIEAKPEPEETLLFPENIEMVQTPPPPLAALVPKPNAEPQHYIRTTQNEDAGTAPMKADFISDRNTVASSKLPSDSKTDSPMPTTNGVNVPTFELANRNFKDGEVKNDSATVPPPAKPAPMPTPALQPTPPKLEMRQPEPDLQIVKKEETPSEKMVHEAEKDGSEHLPLDVRKPMNKADEPPKQREPMDDPPVPKAIPIATPPTPPPAPVLPKPEKNAFSPETRTSKQNGGVSKQGDEDAVNAVGSPSGRYMREVTGAVEKRWGILRLEKGDFIQPGKLRLHFYVNKQGKPEGLEVISGDAKALLREFSMRAVKEANIPRIPQDLLPILDQGRFEIEYDIVVY